MKVTVIRRDRYGLPHLERVPRFCIVHSCHSDLCAEWGHSTLEDEFSIDRPRRTTPA